jgi:hypothetical protein
LAAAIAKFPAQALTPTPFRFPWFTRHAEPSWDSKQPADPQGLDHPSAVLKPPTRTGLLYWPSRKSVMTVSVTAYNVTDGTMPETDQLMPSVNGYYDLPRTADGSIEVWFGPEKPKEAADVAFIKTIPGRDFLVTLRLYGTELAFYDQTWKPDDVVKVK